MPTGIYVRSQAIRDNLRIKMLGTHRHLGFKHSEEARKKMSKSHIGQISWNKGKTTPLETRIKQSIKRTSLNIIGEKHPRWKGDNVGYGALHTWIQRTLGKANKCEISECVYPRRNSSRTLLKNPKYHWANISHKYKRDIKDWIQLCNSCHRKYDMGIIKL